MSDSDLAILNGSGRYGFFSYVMNIDLKRDQVPPNFTVAMPYPEMPRLGGLHKPVATVVLYDTVSVWDNRGRSSLPRKRGRVAAIPPRARPA